ncbi:MAG: ActS/PrrB/RegB family redox-sensitive histidine kinase [Rhizobiales bacterium]|nr:ActS/PrrB/RegB family redox-sensitive histidine kinase [Hyphomicrobiales bacterium]
MEFRPTWKSAAGPEELPSLRTLVRLRWMAVIGQSVAVLGVYFGMEFPLPLGWCLAVIALSAWLNVFLAIRWPSSTRLTSRATALLLGYDILQLAALLYLTGGLENPFSFLFLVPVTVSATSLQLRWTLALSAFAFVCASILAFVHLPLPWSGGVPLSLPQIYVTGMWVAIVCGVVFSAIYARRIAEEARQMSAALTATELVLAREQRLSALDGLAAAAAHELGTPLATIALVAKELKRELPPDGPHTEDIDLLIGQASRCRDILARLANRDTPADDIYQQVKLTSLVEDLVAPLRGPDIEIDVQAAGMGPEPVLRRNPAIGYGLGNILENAVDFAVSTVIVKANWTPVDVNITVSDDGPGFQQGVFERLGDPFVTTRPGYGAGEADGGHQGMGLGFFIAKTLLERSGASVALANPGNGAEISIVWPRPAVEAGTLSGNVANAAAT